KFDAIPPGTFEGAVVGHVHVREELLIRMTHAWKGIEIRGVIGIAIGFVRNQRADHGGRNVRLVPRRGVEASHGDLIAGGFRFARRLNLPVLMEIGAVGRTFGVSSDRETGNCQGSGDSKNRRQGNAHRASQEIPPGNPELAWSGTPRTSRAEHIKPIQWRGRSLFLGSEASMPRRASSARLPLLWQGLRRAATAFVLRDKFAPFL